MTQELFFQLTVKYKNNLYPSIPILTIIICLIVGIILHQTQSIIISSFVRFKFFFTFSSSVLPLWGGLILVWPMMEEHPTGMSLYQNPFRRFSFNFYGAANLDKNIENQDEHLSMHGGRLERCHTLSLRSAPVKKKGKCGNFSIRQVCVSPRMEFFSSHFCVFFIIGASVREGLKEHRKFQNEPLMHETNFTLGPTSA